MLWFLSIAARQGHRVDRYSDSAAGTMALDSEGKLAMTRVVLRPRVTFSGDALPTREQVERMHHLAHEQCFIARSVKSAIICEPVLD
jgi:organic hydroperoxide reductase OsmC/OhrA